MEQKIKKGAVDLTDLAIGIVVLGVVASIGSTILISHRDNRRTDLPTVSTNNEVTSITAAGDTLTNGWVSSVDSCVNYTDGTAIASGNYTTSVNNIDGIATISNATVTTYANVTCNYTWYNTSQADYALANDAATGIAEYGNWFTILVVVGVASLIIALIFMAFGNRSGSSAGISY